MEEKNWLALMAKQTQTLQVLETNQYTKKYGLTLCNVDENILTEVRINTLKLVRRLVFGEGILPKIIYTFCDSAYIMQDNYRDSLLRLQEIFFLYKNEMMDEITDDELLEFMKEQFETICYGDFDYLEGTCLDIFAQAVRAGYSGYTTSQGRGEFEQFDIVTRWDRELYMEALRELTWR